MNALSMSFRGAGKAREPGIHTHESGLWIPALTRFARSAGMTAVRAMA